ncbi:myb/SANT-like DNA-binding domain-containing protein 4 [Uloborus diversus]|uniref:myb/SANT-like DNA-binding domain-containing protein 4 n=1 Tax=Uloborus diversus TaxID=327109 RepID=UPI00240994A6|nr:myb/SANT-like DNA-binding domain-containing protein 4 [Uloborus diversus]
MNKYKIDICTMQKTRAQNYSVEELEAILQHLEERPELASGKFGPGYGTIKEQKLAWKEIADAVNAIGMGPARSAFEIKRKWADFKSRVKSKVEKLALKKSIAGDESKCLTPRCLRLTPHEERALKLISNDVQSNITETDLDTKSEKQQDMNDLNNENIMIVRCKPLSNDDEEIKSAQLGFKIDKCQPKVLLDSSKEKTNVLKKIHSTRLPLLQNKKTLMSGYMYNSHNHNTMIAEVKEVKNEIKELRESMRELVNMHKIALELKCLKYGVQIDELSQDSS